MSAPINKDDRIALNALADGELDAAAAAALTVRIAAEPLLAAAHDEIVATHDAIAALPRPEVSAEFLQRIAALTTPAPQPAAAVPMRARRWDGWQNIAATVLVTALIASSATYFVSAPREASLETLVASDHKRSLLAASPVDVLSSDRHTVKPWLDARLGVSPPAPDMKAEGYALIGGRVDVIGNEPVPTLVYRHNEHVISVMALPGSTASTTPRSLAAGGYYMVEWSGNGFDFIAVSDLEADELAAFVQDYRTAAGEP